MTTMAEIKKDVDYLKEGIDDIKHRLDCFDDRYVSMDRFKPIEKLVYCVVGVVVTCLVGGVLALLVQS